MKMKNLFLFAVLFACGTVITQGSLWELQKMIKQVTGKSAILNYSRYGCYCGWGGNGMPKDDTDKCCLLHDCCYDMLHHLGCNAKLKKYRYFYMNGEIYCGMENKCKSQSCKCDGKLVLCLKKHLGSYNKKYSRNPKKHCGIEEVRCSEFAQMH